MSFLVLRENRKNYFKQNISSMNLCYMQRKAFQVLVCSEVRLYMYCLALSLFFIIQRN